MIDQDDLDTMTSQELYDEYRHCKTQIAAHIGLPLPPELADELDRIISAAERRFGCHPSQFPWKRLATEDEFDDEITPRQKEE